MDVVLGVSMTPAAVRMALVEGSGADGLTLDQDCFHVASGVSAATSDAPERVVAAILGTRESAAEGGHHLTVTGVAWTDHAAAARLRQSLRAQRIDDVILVSELHAASALAQAIGAAADYQRTALLFVDRDTATLAVVRTADGSVVKVTSRGLNGTDVPTELQAMITGLESGCQPPQALFLVGSGVDAAALKPQLASRTALPVHAPDDGDLALARGAALAAVNIPRYEAATVGLSSFDDTVVDGSSFDDTGAGPTQMAAAGYMAPLGYSAVPDDDEPLDLVGADAETIPADRRPFLLLGSAMSAIFVVGVVALAISLAVVIRPAADQRPAPSGSAVVSNSAAPAPPQAQQPAPPVAVPETIQAPIPVVQEAPRTVFVAPREPAPVPAPVALAPAPEPAAVPAPAPAPASAPAPAVPAPAPAIVPPIVIPVPIGAPALPPIFQIPSRRNPVPQRPSTTVPTTAPTTVPTTAPTTAVPSSAAAPTTQATQPSPPTPTSVYPTYTAPVTPAPSVGSGDSAAESGSGSASDSDTRSRGSQPTWAPLWPFGG